MDGMYLDDNVNWDDMCVDAGLPPGGERIAEVTLDEVARFTLVSVADLKAPTRGIANIAAARQLAMLLMRRMGLTTETIGYYINRHASTVSTGVKFGERRCIERPLFARGAEWLQETIESKIKEASNGGS